MLALPRLARLCVLAFALPSSAQTDDWRPLHPTRATSEKGATLEIRGDSIEASGANPDTDSYLLELETDLALVTGLRLDVELDPLVDPDVGRSPSGNFVLSEIELVSGARDAKKLVPVTVAFSQASFEQSGFSISGSHDGVPRTGWAVSGATNKAHAATFELASDTRGATGSRWNIAMRFAFGGQHTIRRLRWSATGAARPIRLRSEQDAWSGMQVRIDRAIDQGVQYLLARQQLDGSWGHAIGEYRNGQTSLAVYALLKSGVPPAHQAVRRGFEFLRTNDPDKTYAAGLQMLALHALGKDAERATIERVAESLIETQQGGWAYPGGDVDISNSQYGALGLWVATKHGVDVPQRAWQNLATFAIAQQEKSEGAYAPAGFTYRSGFPVTGSRTAAGLTCISICKEMLPESDPVRRQCVASEQRALAWLAKNFTAAADPLSNSDEWIYYWLYGCERVGALTGQKDFGAHDWYREGARYLVDAQKGDGEWSNEPNTCFALLFLNRATARATGEGTRAVKTYGEDDPRRDVSLRAAGDSPLKVWISSFGDAALRDHHWKDDPPGSLRIERVDFLLPAQALLADARAGSVEWKTPAKPPPADWFTTAFDDASWKSVRGSFAPSLESDPRMRTPWNGAEICLRTAVVLDADDLVEPELVVRFASASNEAAAAATPPLVCLFDENRKLADELHGSGEGGQVSLVPDAYRGKAALRVTPQQKFREVVPGWAFEIAKKPGPSQYRYLQFAWRKRDGDGVMIQLAREGKWGEGRSARYWAGRNPPHWEGEQIDKNLPEEWAVVTRDLYEDLGEGARLTGIALTVFGGSEAHFDSLYLARSKADLATVDKTGIACELAQYATNGADVKSGPPSSPDALRVWINGQLAYTCDGRQLDYEVVEPAAALRSLFQDGPNVIAVQAASPTGRSLDVGLRDARPLAFVRGDPARASGSDRFSSRLMFPRPGSYEVTARVRVLSPPDATGKSRTTDLFSEPLKIDVRDAFDSELYAYASDPTRNLLISGGASARASSELGGWPASRAIDGLLFLGWLCNDGDAQPSLSFTMGKAVRANALAFTHPQLALHDKDRTARVRRLSVRFNGQDPAYPIELERDDAHKTVWNFPAPIVVKSFELRVLERIGVAGTKDGVGLAEVELRMSK